MACWLCRDSSCRVSDLEFAHAEAARSGKDEESKAWTRLTIARALCREKAAVFDCKQARESQK